MPEHPRGSLIQRIGVKILLALLALLLGLYIGEFAFRTWLLTPSVPRNEAEFREQVATAWPRALTSEKAPGTLRILGLSDSFGVVGGTHNYHYVLEGLLRDQGLSVEMVNLSVGSYDPLQELELLHRFGESYAPDLVLHGFFVGNDFGMSATRTMQYRGIPVSVEPGWRSWTPGNLLMFRWMDRYLQAMADQKLQREEQRDDLTEGTMSRQRFLAVERVRLSACRRPEQDALLWPSTTRVLDATRETAERMGAQYFLLVHPDQFQIEPELFDAIVAEYQLDPDDYDLELTLRYLRSWAGSRGTPFLDVTPMLRAEGRGGGLYLPLDTHYNERGNELVARQLSEVIAPLLREMNH